MKVVFCWSDISGYMASCWRALHANSAVTVNVLAFAPGDSAAFSRDLMQGVPCRLLSDAERYDSVLIKSLVMEQQPDVVFVSGWFHKSYRDLALAPELSKVRMVMGMDTPWLGSAKQYLARWVLRRYLARMDRVAVPGERSYQYARRLGVDPARIIGGLYGIDYTAWSAMCERRLAAPWPQAFLFTGRYVTEKAVDILVAAYRSYRSAVDDPWQLLCCGRGPLAGLLQDEDGIDDLGFVQPSEQPALYQRAGVFVLPSRYDPWPLALVEAAASGLPVVCTSACGSSVELVRDRYNGVTVPADNADALAQALVALHNNYGILPLWGARGRTLAAVYSADLWAERWQAYLQQMLQNRQ